MAMEYWNRAWLGIVVVLIALPVWRPASADVDTALQAKGWLEVSFDGKALNRFAVDAESGVVVQSEDSVSLLQKPVDVDLEATPHLTWRWQVISPAPPTDLSIKGGDDRSLAIYVAFPFVPEEASAMERMKRAIVEKIVGKEAPGRVLMYVWGGLGERGARIKSPYVGDAGMITILRPTHTELNAWFEETINVVEDYRRTFGTEPPNPISIAIGADTDDTLTYVEGSVAYLNFVP